MGRPVTRKVNLKEGYYIEVKNGIGDSGIKIHRDTFEQIKVAYQNYSTTKVVTYLGKYVNGKFQKDEDIK